MIEFKKGDFLVSKTNDNGLTIGKHYEIIDEYISSPNMGYLGIIDDNSNYWNYHLSDANDQYYYNKFFYTKSDIRDMKLKELAYEIKTRRLGRTKRSSFSQSVYEDRDNRHKKTQ